MLTQLPPKEEVAPFINQINNSYYKYVETISVETMAISLELAAYLLWYCVTNEPKRILDLGTGFSSFIFRLFSSGMSHVNVVSVDHSKEWLSKTINYVSIHKLPLAGFYLWEEFRKQDTRAFDLVFYDLGYKEFRLEQFRNVLDYIGEGGVMILDDMHKDYYLNSAISLGEELGYKYVSLEECTNDKYGRYSSLLCKR